jgi:hypothetical protein
MPHGPLSVCTQISACRDLCRNTDTRCAWGGSNSLAYTVLEPGSSAHELGAALDGCHCGVTFPEKATSAYEAGVMGTAWLMGLDADVGMHVASKTQHHCMMTAGASSCSIATKPYSGAVTARCLPNACQRKHLGCYADQCSHPSQLSWGRTASLLLKQLYTKGKKRRTSGTPGAAHDACNKCTSALLRPSYTPRLVDPVFQGQTLSWLHVAQQWLDMNDDGTAYCLIPAFGRRSHATLSHATERACDSMGRSSIVFNPLQEQ